MSSNSPLAFPLAVDTSDAVSVSLVFDGPEGSWELTTSPSGPNLVADVARLADAEPMKWTMRMAPDGTGVTLDHNGYYLTQKILLREPPGGARLLLSTSLSDAVHLITANTGAEGSVVLACEDGTGRFLTCNPDPNANITVGLVPQDQKFPGARTFSPSAFAPIAPPSLTAMRTVPSEVFAGETVVLGKHGQFLTINADGSLSASAQSEDAAVKFSITPSAGYGSVTISSGQIYLGVSDDGRVVTQTVLSAATPFTLFATDEGVVISTYDVNRRYWCADSSGPLHVEERSVWSEDLLFDLEMEAVSDAARAARLGLDINGVTFTPCETAVAQMVVGMTSGLFLAAGLGSGTVTTTPTPGLLALLSRHPAVANAVRAATADWNSMSVVANAFRVGGAAAIVFKTCWDEGILIDVLKFLAPTVGWYLFYRVVAKALTFCFAGPAETIALVASYITWFAGIVQTGLTIINTCGAPQAAPPITAVP